MLSRIADSLYWMSRYLERADNTARLVEINLIHLLEAEDALPEAARVAARCSRSAAARTAYSERYDGARGRARARVIQFMTRERAQPGLDPRRACASRARTRAWCATASRSEMWEAINELWLRFEERARRAPPERAGRYYRWLRIGGGALPRPHRRAP